MAHGPLRLGLSKNNAAAPPAFEPIATAGSNTVRGPETTAHGCGRQRHFVGSGNADRRPWRSVTGRDSRGLRRTGRLGPPPGPGGARVADDRAIHGHPESTAAIGGHLLLAGIVGHPTATVPLPLPDRRGGESRLHPLLRGHRRRPAGHHDPGRATGRISAGCVAVIEGDGEPTLVPRPGTRCHCWLVQQFSKHGWTSQSPVVPPSLRCILGSAVRKTVELRDHDVQ